MSEAHNIAVVEWLMLKAWNQGDLSGIEQNVMPMVTHHNRGITRHSDHTVLRQMVENWRTAFPDFEHQMISIVAQGDLVSLRAPFSGTHTGVFHFGALTVPPSGKRVNIEEMLLVRFEGGKIAEVWDEFDLLGLLQQIGAAGNRVQTAPAATA